MIEAVIFDMDGLLFDTEGTYVDASRKVALEMGFDLGEEVFHSCVGVNHERTEAILLEASDGKLPIGEWNLRVHKKVVEKFETDGIPVKAGASTILALLEKRGFPMAVASSTSRGSVLKMVAATGFDKYFSFYSCGDEVVHSKPHPEIFLNAAAGLKADPAKCLVFEDSPAGIRAAEAAGMRPVMVPDLIPPGPEFYSLIYRVCPGLNYAVNIIDELLN